MTATCADTVTHTVYYACKYTPTELLAGLGAQARLAEADVPSFDEADRLAHPNLCGYGKGLIERLLASDVHEVVLVTCCDVIRRAYDVVCERGNLDFAYLLDLPHHRDAAARRLFRARLADLAERYAAYSGRGFDAGAALAAFVPPLPREHAPISLLGAHATSSLLDAISSAIDRPVENRTCTERHVLASPPARLARAQSPASCAACEAREADGGPLDDFLDWYADALLDQMPCMRMTDASARTRLVGAEGQRGIIYHTMKFCDYYGFEYAALTTREDVPMVKVETDGSSQSAGQLRTRLEAFGEALRGTDADATTTRTAPGGQTYVLGVDSGSTSTDAAIVDGAGEVVASVIVPTGAKATESARRAKAEVLGRAGLSEDDMALKVATGYGRDSIPDMDSSITEITCHARGAHLLAPEARTIIDIGGQDSKVIHLDENGNVLNFVMNDKCAAGTGRFMEMMARALEMPLDEFCATGLTWKRDVRISSMCTVFAESEVVSLVAQDTPVPDIIHGLCESVARKTATLAKRVRGEAPYLMTGGVANNAGVVRALEDVLGAPVRTHEESQLCGAIGAALLGLDSMS
ncbi:putative CoA-substrate-specific enzyme activase [Olsenella profusa DSM 13989]|uniref:acyl-CoA dehydratase activase n=1 Tax=Olsenella profusa TaxID=138595 RepID=UPI002782EFF0|nr:acyl-CoA dehydratase activase [Olsenella profusa]MDP9859687.1 putative CoA-substrate-specific enzyme activase [Olsenella profusa DSM 13989]